MAKLPQLISELKEDHARFARIISVLNHQLRKIKAGDSEDWKLLADSFEYIEAYPDLVHHPREGAVYRYCSESYPGMVASLEGLEAEHSRICEATSQLSQKLNGVLADSFLNREELIDDLEAYLKMQSSHMAKEEGQVFPQLMACLSDEDWETLLAELESPEDPLFEDESLMAYDALYNRIMTLEQNRL